MKHIRLQPCDLEELKERKKMVRRGESRLVVRVRPEAVEKAAKELMKALNNAVVHAQSKIWTCETCSCRLRIFDFRTQKTRELDGETAYLIDGFPMDAVSEKILQSSRHLHGVYYQACKKGLALPWNCRLPELEQWNDCSEFLEAGDVVCIDGDALAGNDGAVCRLLRFEIAEMECFNKRIEPKLPFRGLKSKAAAFDGKNIPKIPTGLYLEKTKRFHEDKITARKQEYGAMKSLLNDYKRVDRQSLKNEQERTELLERFENAIRERFQASRNTLEESERLFGELESRLRSVKSEYEMLSGKRDDAEKLFWISGADPRFSEMVRKTPLFVLENVVGMPLYIDIKDTPEQSWLEEEKRPKHRVWASGLFIKTKPKGPENRWFDAFVKGFEYKDSERISIIPYAPDPRWENFHIRFWVPQGYSLRPFFFNYTDTERKLARSHLLSAFESCWEECEELLEKVRQKLEHEEDSQDSLEFALVPGARASRGSRDWERPCLVAIDNTQFVPLSKQTACVNLVHKACAPEAFEKIAGLMREVTVNEFRSRFIPKESDESAGPSAEGRSDLVEFWRYALTEDVQKYLIRELKEKLVGRAEALVDQRAEEICLEMEDRIDQLEQKRRELKAKTDRAQEALEQHHAQWTARFREFRQNLIDRYYAPVRQLERQYQQRLTAIRTSWQNLENQSDALVAIRRELNDTKGLFDHLMGRLNLTLAKGVAVTVAIIVAIAAIYLSLDRFGGTIP